MFVGQQQLIVLFCYFKSLQAAIAFQRKVDLTIANGAYFYKHAWVF